MPNGRPATEIRPETTEIPKETAHSMVKAVEKPVQNVESQPIPDHKIVGEALKTYIIVEVGTELVLIDKHAAHERVLKQQLIRLCDQRQLDLILTTGGTGCSARDITPEATLAIADKNVPGIAEAMRAESLKITRHAMISRAASVIRGKTLIINLPGSPRACMENMDVFMDTIPHAMGLLRNEPLGTVKELASWRSYVAAVHERRAGDRLGYGEGLTLDKDTRVATVGIGYGDGLALRFAEVNAPVLICGKMAHVIAVFMDQCLVDVTGIDCVPGDEVTIFGYDGHGGYISSQSQALLTDALEGCGITSGLSTRVARVYVG